MSQFAATPTAHRPTMTTLARTEWKLFLREPVGLFWGVAFPVVLMLIIGNIPSFREPDKSLGGLRFIDTYVTVMIAFVCAMLALNALPPLLTSYREKGILRRLSTTPVRPIWVLTTQLAINLAVALVAGGLLLAAGRIVFDVALPRQVLAFAVAFLLTACALLALGLFVAAVAPTGRIANAAGAILWFPLMFFAGLWVPRAVMPSTLHTISDYTPLGAGVQALQDAASGAWPQPLHLIVLAAYVIVFGVASARLFRWE